MIDLINRRKVVVKECYLLLYPDYMEYKVIVNYEVLNQETAIWEPIKCNYKWTRLRSSISQVEMFKDNKENTWTIGIEYHGISTASQWDFADAPEALDVYTKLKNYFIGK